MVATAAAEGCPCIDSTGTLASLPDARRCRLAEGEDGVQLTLGGSCVPTSYGSSRCLQHDLIHDPACRLDNIAQGEVPPHCFRSWCYVDSKSCRQQTSERVLRSSYFAFDSGVDLFYSYSTCGSSADDWLAAADDIVGVQAMGGISIQAVIPTYIDPLLFKIDRTGEPMSSPGIEYYDDDVPFNGAYVTYAKRIMEISEGDIQAINFSSRSKASDIMHPTSSFTASVQDVQDGLFDMGIGPWWITGQRLKMTAFTLPIVIDKTYLVIPKPETSDSLMDQTWKVLMPFKLELWGVLLGIIAVTSLLSVWYNDRSKQKLVRRERALIQSNRPMRRKRPAYVRLALDSFLQNGLFFCSAGVEQDRRSSLPMKTLMFGFGFFILISVSAYVANLAAFLTLSMVDVPVRAMKDAVKAGLTICAHPALQEEMQSQWPDAKFYFHQDGKEFPGVLDDYNAGKCGVLAIGWEDTGSDTAFLENLCNSSLVITDSVVVEMPVAFPIRSQLAAGFSYWMMQGEKEHGITIERAKEDFAEDISCDYMFDGGSRREASEYDSISIRNMFFPLAFFGSFLIISVLLQIVHNCKIKSGRRSVLGRNSSLNLVEDYDPLHRRSSFNPFRRKTVDSTTPNDDEPFSCNVGQGPRGSTCENFHDPEDDDDFQSCTS